MKLEITEDDVKDISYFGNIYDDDEIADDEMIGIELGGNLDNLLIKCGYFKDNYDISNYRENEYNGWFELVVYLKENFGDLILRVLPYNEDMFTSKEFTLYGTGLDELKTKVVILMSSR